ncbi:MAG: NADH-quinone oxidoreductase subunit N [Bacteroidetes bacterium]|nr:NADH-quinone oxidoreductase subunit N [Bacteroidota bacterium]MBU1371918.1 NADH-quinone oxidoreductase subunit N [Bacteroidota bacterium]MBU1483520.1 NADH-quinone oxidoreductase subunit N [Bacteroidota bacterium]MBU1761048.1 NADH-quinone oxidoreductase subunit N [Bacteroidota bacterium]MBU2045692.1 NADH-quinone oxidoreductase subunit N [Bacteroidota bacterium]
MQNIQQSTTDTLHSLSYLKPEWTLAIGFLLVIVLDLFVKKSKLMVFAAAMLTLLLSAVFLIIQFPNIGESQLLFNGMFSLTKAGTQFKLLILFASVLALIFFYQDERLKNHPKGINDFISIFLAAVLGMFLLISSANLLMLYLSIEMISLASYLMVSYSAYENKQAEAGMKYLLFGAVASAMMLYGISLIYGFTGSINLYGTEIINGFQQIGTSGSALAIVLLMAGIGFKLSFVPFHFWTPDAYQTAPTSVTSFLSSVPKIAVFGFLFLSIPILQLIGVGIFVQIILIVSAASMILGNIVATFQDDPKRMMAYSSIGHTGFMLMLFILPQDQILKALTFYLLAYTLMNAGTFMSISYIESRFGVLNISDYKGLGKKIPYLGFLLVILMVSLTGLPPTAGFIGKFLVFTSLISSAADSSYVTILLIIAALTTVISLFFYLKIPLNFFLKKSNEIKKETKLSALLPVVISLLVFLIILFGIFPFLLNSLII